MLLVCVLDRRLQVTVSKVSSAETGPGCFRQTVATERVHGVTSQYGVWHTARVLLSAAGEVRVWVDRRPVRPVALPAAVAAKPGLLGFATYQFPSPTFANFTVAADLASRTPGAAAGWPAPAAGVSEHGEHGPTSVAYRAVVPDVWGAQINSLVLAPNGDIVALSNNGNGPHPSGPPWRNGVNALIRSTDGGMTFKTDRRPAPLP